MPMDIMMNVIVALVYLGAGDKEPRSQVARIPPELVIMKAIATDVARLMWGELLLAIQVDSAGAAQYAPVIEKNRDP